MSVEGGDFGVRERIEKKLYEKDLPSTYLGFVGFCIKIYNKQVKWLRAMGCDFVGDSYRGRPCHTHETYISSLWSLQYNSTLYLSSLIVTRFPPYGVPGNILHVFLLLL